MMRARLSPAPAAPPEGSRSSSTPPLPYLVKKTEIKPTSFRRQTQQRQPPSFLPSFLPSLPDLIIGNRSRQNDA